MTFKKNAKSNLPDCLACVNSFIMTSKTIGLNESGDKATIHVSHIATKQMVKRALEAMFNVKVSKIGVVNVKGETKMTKRGVRKTASYKKMFVTVEGGNFRVSDILAGEQ